MLWVAQWHHFSTQSHLLLLTLTPFVLSTVSLTNLILFALYDYLRPRKVPEYAEGFIIEGLRVQFLPVFNPLNDEGVQTANSFSVNDVIIQVMAPEYLVANMLETGRRKITRE